MLLVFKLVKEREGNKRTYNLGISVMKLKVWPSALRGMSCQGEIFLPSFCSFREVWGLVGGFEYSLADASLSLVHAFPRYIHAFDAREIEKTIHKNVQLSLPTHPHPTNDITRMPPRKDVR